MISKQGSLITTLNQESKTVSRNTSSEANTICTMNSSGLDNSQFNLLLKSCLRSIILAEIHTL